MAEKYIVRTSDRQTFKQCRFLWDFTSRIRLDYEPLRPKDYFEFGTAWHEAMRVWYEANNDEWPLYQSPAREKLAHEALRITTNAQQSRLEELGFGGPDLDTEFDERLKLGKGMLNYYFGWARIHDDFEPVTVEHEFEVPIGYFSSKAGQLGTEQGQPGYEPVYYQGRIDGLVRDFRGNYWLLEHKTAEKESRTGWLSKDSQVGSYIWVLQRELGIPIKGCIYTRAYKRVPEKPKILKSDGSISCDKRQSTTASLFVEAIEEAHPFKPAFETITASEKYLNYHQFLTDPEVAPKFVERLPQTRNFDEIEHLGELIALEAQDMLNDPSIYPNVTPMNCNNCSFKGPCDTRLRGGDWEYQLKSEYWKRSDESH